MSIEKLDLMIQRVIPNSFDNSLSYVESLGKVVNKINELTNAFNSLGVAATNENFYNLMATEDVYIEELFPDPDTYPDPLTITLPEAFQGKECKIILIMRELKLAGELYAINQAQLILSERTTEDIETGVFKVLPVLGGIKFDDGTDINYNNSMLFTWIAFGNTEVY
jgi:hypothetical protein